MRCLICCINAQCKTDYLSKCQSIQNVVFTNVVLKRNKECYLKTSTIVSTFKSIFRLKDTATRLIELLLKLENLYEHHERIAYLRTCDYQHSDHFNMNNMFKLWYIKVEYEQTFNE